MSRVPRALTKLPGAAMHITEPARDRRLPSIIQKLTFLPAFLTITMVITEMIKQTGPIFSLLQPAIRARGMIQTVIPGSFSAGEETSLSRP